MQLVLVPLGVLGAESPDVLTLRYCKLCGSLLAIASLHPGCPLSCVTRGVSGVLLRVLVASTAVTAAVGAAGPPAVDGVAATMLGLWSDGMAHIGICVLAMVVLVSELFRYSFISYSCR